jgi:diguanylate cyclase (GGDEF)-like protein
MPIDRISSSLRGKLVAAFSAVAIFVAMFVAAVTAIHFSTLDRAAQIEAAHVAEFIAEATVRNRQVQPQLQDYVARLNALRKRDVVIVDHGQIGLADANPGEVGMRFDHDPGDEVGKTIADGKTRTFVEENELHPEGARQIVVPLVDDATDVDNPNRGAVILEYTKIHDELLAAEQTQIYLVVVSGLLAVLVVTGFGLRVAHRISLPLRRLKQSVERISARDYSARVPVTSRDEIGALGLAFNELAENLSVSHAEIALHERDLEQRIADRTEELNHANVQLQQQIQQREIAAERAEYLAYYDGLTALPNRSMFSRLLEQAISRAKRSATHLAVLFVDLDRFKNINDTLGHEAGDQLLCEVSRRLKDCLRESDTVARLGGDEFVILLPDLIDVSYVDIVAQKVLAATSKPVMALGQALRVTASVGASTYPKDGDDEQALMKHADIAMYQAKEAGRDHFEHYSAAMNTHSFERLVLESSLRRALEDEELQLLYQPTIDARTGAIAGVEALLRWVHPTLGLLPPSRFIPAAEETGLIVAIGRWVLKTACRQNVAWKQRGFPSLTMAVNLSARQFFDDDLVRDVAAALRETGMRAALLELEIAETTLTQDRAKTLVILKKLKDLGVRIAIDHFGTGYTSLTNFREFHVDTIKIDGSFIRGLSDEAENRDTAEAIIALAKNLGPTIVAECVETQAQIEFLRQQACDEFQGFFFSPAVTASQFWDLLATQMTAEATQ